MAKKVNQKMVVKKEVTQDELQKLAHAGTKEAIAKLEAYIEAETDPEKQAYGEMALEECEMFYYEPTNEKEDEEFLLCELIRRREQEVDDLFMQIDDAKLHLDKTILEKKVHDKVLANNKNKKKAWADNWSEEILTIEKADLKQMEEELAYAEAWIVEAKKMITTERYQNIPARYLEHFDFAFDEDFDDEDDYEDYWEDECGDECCK